MTARFALVWHRIDWADGTASTCPAVLDRKLRMVARVSGAPNGREYAQDLTARLNGAPRLVGEFLWRAADSDGGTVVEGEQ